jgi:hypothetical protein
MDKAEVQRLISTELEAYRAKTYKELVSLIGSEPITYDVTGSDGTKYQIEIEAAWDNEPNGNIRILGSIDDGGFRSFCPMSDDFIKSPSDEFIGE